MDDVLAHEVLVGHLADGTFSVLKEDDDVVQIGAETCEFDLFVFFQIGADEAFLLVDVEFLVGYSHRCGVDVVEILDLGKTLVFSTVLLL